MNTTTNSRTTHRRNKRDLLAEFLSAHFHQPISSAELHSKFGSAVRTRISELNRDLDSGITVRNFTYCTPTGEVSLYTASPRRPTSAPTPTEESLFGDLSPEGSYPD
jgi:hypothetical protein